MEIVFAVLGIAFGIVLGILLTKGKLNKKVDALTNEKNELERERDVLSSEKTLLEKSHAKELESQEKRHKEAVEGMKSLFGETMGRVTAEVKDATK